MYYNSIREQDVLFFKNRLGISNVLVEDGLDEYASDHTEDIVATPEIVVFPKTTKHVSLILSYCNENKIPVTPSASLTGLSGGGIPIYGGVSMSMKKMNSILNVDVKNFQATIQPGVINEEFQNFLQSKNLFYPPDPASKGTCTLGGNFALNAGGPKAVKYGVTSNYVLNMEIVLPNGTVFWTGANTLKNATGYNLTQLIIGSEGTLAVITKAVVKLLPLPSEKLLMLVPFDNNVDACDAVNSVMLSGCVPSSLEFMERDAVLFVQEQNYCVIPFKISKTTSSYLLIEIDGNSKKLLLEQSEKIYSILQKYKCGEILFAEDSLDQKKVWKVRQSIGLAVKSYYVYKEEDTVVPRSELVTLLSSVKEIGKKYGFRSICYGHAGDGNLHINILKENLEESVWTDIITDAIREIFELCVQLGGTISGEHGIGLVQKKYLDIPFTKEQLELQKNIKTLFDPNMILNPGKIFN